MTDTAAVLERIQERLRAQDMSVRAAEEQAGHPNWIRHLAAGRVRSVNMQKLAAFAPVLETTLAYLAHGEGAPSVARLPPPPPEATSAVLGRLRASQGDRREAKRLRTPPALLTVRGEVAAGHWLQIDQHDEPAFEPVDLPADRRWPAEWQYGLVVRGTSINNVAPDGAFLLCVDVKAIRHTMRDGELIIVEQRKDGGHMIERTAKRYKRRGHLHELWPDSSDPRWREPIVIDTTREDESLEVEMVGLVVWVHMPVLPIPDFDPRGDMPVLTHGPSASEF